VTSAGPAAYGVADFFRASAHQRTAIEEQLRRIDAERATHEKNREAVLAQATAARRDLAQSLLPGLVPRLVARARDLTGFAPWRTEDPVAAMDAERAAVERRLAAIAADPLFMNGELLFHPRTGTHTRELAELEGHLATQQRALSELMCHPRFTHLVDAGYGTERYAVPFWRLTYYDDWKAHDEIVEQFPGVTFPELARRYEEASAAEQTLRDEVARVNAIIARGQALFTEHAALTRRLGALSGEHLTAAQVRLLEHVLTSHGATMRAALGRDPAILGLYLRASALEAKVRYLDHVFVQDVGSQREVLQRQLQKILKDQAKYRRAKHAAARFPREAFERRFGDRSAAYERRWDRYRKRYLILWRWSAWDDVPDDDFVWWDVMTGARPDGDAIPEVAEFRRRHGRPSWIDGHRGARTRASEDDDDLAVAAAIAAEASGGSAGRDVAFDAS
jgi:hypothetical protein